MKEWIDNRNEFNAKSIAETRIPDPGFIPGYYTHIMRTTFKNNVQ